MKRLLITILLILPNILFCQSTINYGRTYTDTLPQKFKVEISVLRNHIYSGIPSYSKKGKYEKVTYKFADLSAHHISELLSSGYVYSDWDNLENYLNKILKKVIPIELARDPLIHVYIYKGGDYNAFMTPSGQLFFNIGMFSDLDNESKIAAIFAHELAHYYKRHSLDYFIKKEFGAFSGGLLDRDWEGNTFSKADELEADSLAMIWMKNSDYNIISLYRLFKIMESREQKQLSRSEDKWIVESNIPHATSQERLTSLKRMYKKYKDSGGSFFLVNKEKFERFREESKAETLKFLLDDHYYYSCLERSFRFHLLDPGNQTYIYYLMESIRKICLKKYRFRENNSWNENFITNRYYDTLRVKGVRKKRKVNRSLFEKLDFSLLPITQEEARYIKAKFYWTEESRFKTYNEAFEFYNKLGQALNCNECLLSYALGLKGDTLLRNKYLNAYLSKDSIKYRDFAANFINGNITNANSTNKLLILHDIYSYVKQGPEIVPIRESFKRTNLIMNNIIDSLKISYPERTFLCLSDLRNYNLNDYKAFNDMRFLSSYEILDPCYLYLFKKYNINEVEFLSSEFHESRNLNNSLTEYKKIIHSSYMNFFNKTKSTRYFDLRFRSVKLINNKRIEYIPYKKIISKNIKFKESAYPRMIARMRAAIRIKKKFDY